MNVKSTGVLTVSAGSE